MRGPGGGQGFDPRDAFGDIFGDVFGDIFGGGRRGRSQVFRGADLRYELELTLEQAVFGDTVNVDFATLAECERVQRQRLGARAPSPSTCKTCGGAGQVRMQQGFFTVQQTCPRCTGRGQVVSDPCATCRGQGRVRKQKTLSVKVPAGVDNGDRIRLAGEGEAGRNGGPPGDLYVEIRVRDARDLRARRRHLSCEVPVSFATAALGRQRRSADARRRGRPQGPGRDAVGPRVPAARQGRQAGARRPTGDLFCRVVVETPVHLHARAEGPAGEIRRVAAARTRNAITRARSPGSTA